MEKIKFSVVVPIYNAEKYLGKCIDSVLNQGYDNFELILVDDGSKDLSPSICDKYAEKDSRIKVIHKPNGGEILARRSGMMSATGDYLLFLDSDDYWAEGAFIKIAETINRYDCDVVVFNYKRICSGYDTDVIIASSDERIYFSDSKNELYKIFLTSSKMNNVWSKAIKKEIVENSDEYEKFSHLKYGSDAVQSAKILVNAQKIASIPDCLYCYRIGSGITGTSNPRIISDSADVRQYIIDLFENINYVGKDDDIITCYENYLNDTAPRIIASYGQYQKETVENLKRIIKHKFYKAARSNAKKVNFLARIIWFMVEHRMYFIIGAFSVLFKIKRKF